ncbi:excalibur calcium-binding domain-containing protein [Paenibacillus alkaliterrae]|uniref:excalibur calcium-binding domain-containing protein n=1 Tax=Paenibacillus alkaliterrae TaxID=320909 RepID=UPI001F44E746|nr:excalibur calcium-binding domain-containing protein [Paenibacillus alkaliterrae]MCF2939056.1 excalibur calcium-binding domain-containing protein [Paenibacillus alkaliterrae]
MFVINGGGNTTVETAKPDLTVVYNSCAEAKAAGKAPIRIGDPGYSTKLDRDGDGVACES